MNVFENPVLAKGIAIAAIGVAAGLLLSIGVGVVRLVLKCRRRSIALSGTGLLLAIAMAVTPITKLFYAFVVAVALSQRNLAESELAVAATASCGIFAMVAIMQGALAVKLVGTPMTCERAGSAYNAKFALLGAVETLAVFALVGTLVLTARLSA